MYNNRRPSGSPSKGSPSGDKQSILRELASNPFTSQFFFPGALFVVSPWNKRPIASIVVMVNSHYDLTNGQPVYSFTPIGHCHTTDPSNKVITGIVPFADELFDTAMNFKTVSLHFQPMHSTRANILKGCSGRTLWQQRE
uniref:Uncharacterized protein n=1 Tax=Clandestinovirus TaxID=2831644 RepID=A0A8F8PNA1_9VIRU|nr:hypothetical protein KOM_12_354 [Clandestinovirus]